MSDPVVRAWALLDDILPPPLRANGELGFFAKRRLRKAEALLAASTTPQAQWGQARLCYVRGEYAASLEIFRRLIAQQNVSVALLRDAARAAMLGHTWELAQMYARQALEMNADDAEAACDYAAALLLAGETKRAMGVITNTCKRDPNHSRARHLIEVTRRAIQGTIQPTVGDGLL